MMSCAVAELMEMTEAAVPPAGSVMDAGAALQAGGKAAEPVEMKQVRTTGPENPLTEVAVIVSVFPVVAPEVKLSVVDPGVRVKEDAVSVAVITGVGAVALVAPEVAAIDRLRTPLVPGVEVSVTVEVPVPPAVSVTGVAVQAPAAVPLVLLAVQATVTVPAKPLVEVTVTGVVLPVVAPDATASVAVAGVSRKPGLTTVAVTVVDAVAETVEFAVVPLPVMVAVRTPLVPAAVAMLTLVLAVPPEVSVTEVGDTVQEPATVPVPLRLAAAQMRETLPTKPSTEVSVTVLVTALPEARIPEVGKDAGDAARVKPGAVRLTTMVGENTVVVPLSPMTRT